MIYRSRDKLTILELRDDEKNVPLERIKEILFERPSNIIYCEREGRLYGIITMGDVQRACDDIKDSVIVNMNFMKLSEGEYVKARKIFCEKKSINALPLIDHNGIVTGDYSRWDNVKHNMIETGGGYRYKSAFTGHKIAFIRPCHFFREKLEAYDEYCDVLAQHGVDVLKIVGKEMLKYSDRVEYFLTIDEDERRAYSTLVGKIISREDIKIITFKTYFIMKRDDSNYFNNVLGKMSDKGIHFFEMKFEHDVFYNSLLKECSKKYEDIGENPSTKLYPIMYQDFFGDLYLDEEREEITNLLSKMSVEIGSGRLKDKVSRFYNVIDGERYTEGQPQHYDSCIYFCGGCLSYGAFVEDKYTIESFLQKRLNALNFKVKVLNYGSPAHNEAMQLSCVLSMPLKKNDIVIMFMLEDHAKYVQKIDMMEPLKKIEINTGWMLELPWHCNDKMNKLYADVIFEKIKPLLSEENLNPNERIIFDRDTIKTIYLDRYFSAFDSFKYNKIASIVMNCNPFTYGHRYLIERALEIADFLIIFVVEENKSIFSFDERFACVCEGVADLENVMVVPSGPFILSQTSFPEYFIKAADADLVKNVENDVTIFAEQIASQLNITYRFVGEEPEDNVTNEYNLAMKRILPKYGMEVIEIPRKLIEGRCISASWVRECLDTGNITDIKKLVPRSTMRVLYDYVID